MFRLIRLSFLSMVVGISFTVRAEAVPAPGVAGGSVFTLPEAIERAIQNNLSSKLAGLANEAARGRVLQEASGLLPRVTGAVSQARVFKVNLAAQGFSSFPVPGFNPVIGPFDSFDARLQIAMPLLDLAALYRSQAARAGRRVAEFQEKLAREQVAAAASLAYLEAQRTRRGVTSAQADQDLSRELLKLARDQRTAGLSTGVDVVRAETNLAQENLRLIRAQVEAENADVRLKRVAGLPMSQRLQLDEIAPASHADLMPLEQAIASARRDRWEIRIAGSLLEESQERLRALRGENWPSVTALGDYGLSGNTPDNTARTGSIAGRLSLPIFSGGQTQGRIVEAKALFKEAETRSADLNNQVEEDIRIAWQTLAAAAEEAKTADEAVSFAQIELKMARDRFAAGAGDNIQVLTAQTVLAQANDDQVNALAHYGAARVNWAAALGHAQEFK